VINQLSPASAVDRLNDGDMTKSVTLVFHSRMAVAKATKTITQRKELASTIARNLASAKVSNFCSLIKCTLDLV
jgi:hypothetical protein